MANSINDYILILNPGKCGSSWLAQSLTIMPFLLFPRELDFIYFVNYPLEDQWNEDTARDPEFLQIRNNPSLSEEQKLLALYQAEALRHSSVQRLIAKSPSNLYSGFRQYRHLFLKCPIITLYRDPRDIYISNELFQQHQLNNLPHSDEIGQIDYLMSSEILHGSFEKSIQLLRLEKLLKLEGFNMIRLTYEGMKANLAGTIRSILALIELEIDEQTLVQSNYVSEPVPFYEHLRMATDFRPLFRKGIVGDWKNHIRSQEAREWMKRKYGQQLIELGYEVDFHW